MIDIACHKGSQKKLLRAFESEQWPLADAEHYGENLPSFHKSTWTLIAEERGKIIGFVTVLVDTGVCRIESLLVHNRWRRKRVGAALLTEAEDLALEKGCHVMILETGEDWHARFFYEKHGYAVRAELKGYYGERDFVMMDKRL